MADKGGAVGVFGRLAKALGLRKDTREDIVPPGYILHEVSTYGPGGQQEISAAPADFLEEYKRSLWVYDCVSVKARAAAGVPWVLKRAQDGDDEVVTDHPVLGLLERPGNHFTWETMIETIVTHMELVGNAYLEKLFAKGKDKKEKGVLGGLLPLYPDKMKVVMKPKEGIVGYNYRPNQQVIQFEPEEIAHFQYMDPTKESRGVGALAAAFLPSRTDTASTRWNAAFFNRGAHPDVIMSTDKPMPPEERKRIKAEYTESNKGPEKGRGVYVAPYGLKVDLFGTSHREMQFERLKKMSREEIHAAFHVPPVLSGLLDSASYATASVQLITFRDYVLVPLMRAIFAVLKESVLKEYEDGEDLYLDVDTAAMKFPEEIDHDNNRAILLFQANLIDEGEARAMAGMPPWTKEQIAEREKKKQEQMAAMAPQGGGAPPFGGKPKPPPFGQKPGQQPGQPPKPAAKPASPAEPEVKPADKPAARKADEHAGTNGANGHVVASPSFVRLLKAGGLPADDLFGGEE